MQYELGWLFFIYSFLGWLLEVLFVAIRRRRYVDRGVLNPSGLIAGEGLMGVVLAGLAAGKVNTDFSGIVDLGSFGSIVLFLALLGTLVKVCLGKKKA